MAALPSVSGERAVRAFQKAGWVKDRQHGSHVILIKPGVQRVCPYLSTVTLLRVLSVL